MQSDYPINVKDASNPQQLGSALSYARRYGVQSILNLNASDDDGSAASAPLQSTPAALEQLNLWPIVRDALVLDVGASTGGFTDCCLQAGARSVIALDVGTGQLAWELRSDPRVISLEKTDIRNFDPSVYPPINLVVADVSFNSLARLATDFRRAAPQSGTLFLLLVKPQFELGREQVPPGGIVADPALRQRALDVVVNALIHVGFKVQATVESGVSGRKGNQEIFIYARG